MVIAAVIVFALLFLVLPSIQIIGPTQTAVVTRLGNIVGTLDSGPHWRFWMTDSVQRFDLTVRETEIDFAAYSIDAQNVSGRVTVHWSISPTQARAIVEEFGSLERLEARLDSMMIEQVQNVFAMRQAISIVENRAYLGEEIRTRLHNFAPEFRVNITNALVEHLQFSQAFETAVEQRMITDQQLLQAESEAAIALVRANQLLEQSRLESEAILVQARADAEALSIMQDAWGDLGAEVREIMLRQLAIEAWDGVLPKVLGSGDFSLILDSMTD